MSNGAVIAVIEIIAEVIADVKSLNGPGAVSFHKITTGLITDRAGRTFAPAKKNSFADIYFSMAKSVNAEILGIAKGAFMILVREMSDRDLFRDSGYRGRPTWASRSRI